MITCKGCGALREIPPATDRKPCLACGATAVTFHAAGTAVAITTAWAAGRFQANGQTTLPALLLQAVVVPGGKVHGGRLIEAVTLPWFDIVRLLTANPSVAYEIPPHRWEEIVAGSYERAGFDEVILTPRSADGGRDVIATIRGLGSVRVIDQVKAYKPGHLVTADDARALFGVLALDGASKGFLTTTSDFAPRLRDDPLLSPVIPSRIELINGATLITRLNELAGKGKR